MRRKKSWFSQQSPGILILLGLITTAILIATVYLIQRINNSDRKIISLSFIALLLGLLFEYRRISEKWATVLWTTLAAFVFSFLAFAPGKRERSYVFDEHLEMWPYFFLGIFILIAMAVEYSKSIKKITEGITMLLTIAINYWVFSNDYWSQGSLFIKCLIFLNLVISFFSIYHSLSYKSLGRGSRLILSIWSSIITLILSIDNFLKIYKYKDIEQLPTFSESAFVFLQFFLLGVSSIYVAQNLIMVVAYLPGKDYFNTVRDMNDLHLDRFSKEQVYIGDSLIVIIISTLGFSLNYFYNFLPVNLMIWGMITLAPFFLYLLHGKSVPQ